MAGISVGIRVGLTWTFLTSSAPVLHPDVTDWPWKVMDRLGSQ